MSDQIVNFLREAQIAADSAAQQSHLSIQCGHIESALVETMALDCATDLLPLALTASEIVSALRAYNFQRFLPTVLAKVPFDEFILPVGIPRRLVEQRVRRHGQVWQINQNDADPFPSNPHAHNLESGYKLDLGTGELFFRRKSIGKKISRKDLLAIRRQAPELTLPPLVRA